MDNDKLVRIEDVKTAIGVLALKYDNIICGDVIRCVDSIPAVDAVEVVRCRECKHNAQPPDKGLAQCELDALIREPEFWCRAGERREDGDNGKHL